MHLINKRRAPNKCRVPINAGSTRASFKKKPPGFNRENTVYPVHVLYKTLNCFNIYGVVLRSAESLFYDRVLVAVVVA